MEIKDTIREMLAKEKMILRSASAYLFFQLLFNGINVFNSFKEMQKSNEYLTFASIAICLLIVLVMVGLLIKYWLVNLAYKRMIKKNEDEKFLSGVSLAYISMAQHLFTHMYRHFYALIMFHLIYIVMLVKNAIT